jgi:hypothetical protein
MVERCVHQPQIMNNREVYRTFIGFEEQAARIYLQMASSFYPWDRELSALWLDMGMQEKQHAGLLQFCLLEGLLVMSEPTEERTKQITDLFSNLSRRVADPGLGINDAFQIATELETSEINDIYHRLTVPLHSSNYLLRRKIAASIPDHVDRLLQEGRRYGVPEDTLKRLERLAPKGVPVGEK